MSEKGSFNTMASAIEERNRLFNERLRHRTKNYVDVMSPTYSGPITLSDYADKLQPELDIPGAPRSGTPPTPPPADPVEVEVDVKEDTVLVCINNADYEERLMIDCMYDVISRNGIYVTVADRFGEECECRANRFEEMEMV